MTVDVEMFRANGQEIILEMSLVPKGDFFQAQRQDLWAEGAAQGLWRLADYILFKLGGALG